MKKSSVAIEVMIIGFFQALGSGLYTSLVGSNIVIAAFVGAIFGVFAYWFSSSWLSKPNFSTGKLEFHLEKRRVFWVSLLTSFYSTFLVLGLLSEYYFSRNPDLEHDLGAYLLVIIASCGSIFFMVKFLSWIVDEIESILSKLNHREMLQKSPFHEEYRIGRASKEIKNSIWKCVLGITLYALCIGFLLLGGLWIHLTFALTFSAYLIFKE